MLACSKGSCIHGRCVHGSCICGNGWTGNVDILTQDLSHANGPVLKCTGHILTLQLLYGLVAGLCVFAVVFGAAGLVQQWHKYKSMVREGRLQHWYQYTPFVLLLVFCATSAPTAFLLSISKLSSESLNETVGVTHFATWSRVATICATCSFASLNFYSAYALLRRRFTTGGEGRAYQLLRVLNLVHMLANCVLCLSGIYLVVSLTKPSYSYRHVHEMTFVLFNGQRTVAYVIMSSSSALLAWRARDYMDNVIKSRWQSGTALNRLAEEVVKLQRTRRKVLANFLSVAVASAVWAVITLLLVVVPGFRFYNSYVAVAADIVTSLVKLAVINSYTDLGCLFSVNQQPAPEAEDLSHVPVPFTPHEPGSTLPLQEISPDRAQQIRAGDGASGVTASPCTREAAGTTWSIALSIAAQRGGNCELQPAAGGHSASLLAVQGDNPHEELSAENGPAPRRPRTLPSVEELTA